MSIRVFVADDHPIVRQGLKQIVAEAGDMTVVGEAENGVQTVELLRANPCDVLLLDISMPAKNGIDTLKQLRRDMPEIRVLMLSIHPEEHYAVRAIKAGAWGYISKQTAPQQLLGAIRQVAAGRRYVSAALGEQLVRLVGGPKEELPHETLSDREYQTLMLISSGKTLTEIAKELSISVKTVSVYRARLLEKMKLKNNAELAHYAVRNGIID